MMYIVLGIIVIFIIYLILKKNVLREGLAGCSWHYRRNAAISGHNTKHIRGSVATCKRACQRYSWCNSFDYYKRRWGCDLSKRNMWNTRLKTNYRRHPYNHYSCKRQQRRRAAPKFGVRCASEHGWCHGRGKVRYGKHGRYRYKWSNGRIRCNNRTFGDPYRGVFKECHIKKSRSSRRRRSRRSRRRRSVRSNCNRAPHGRSNRGTCWGDSAYQKCYLNRQKAYHLVQRQGLGGGSGRRGAPYRDGGHRARAIYLALINKGSYRGVPCRRVRRRRSRLRVEPRAHCPSGWQQTGSTGADWPGCGLDRCNQRYRQRNISQCAQWCKRDRRCRPFSWAPLNGDKNHRSLFHKLLRNVNLFYDCDYK